MDQWWVSDADKEFQEAFSLSAQPPYKALQLPWDPGDCSAYALHQGNSGSVDAGPSCPGMDTSQLPWDPGGSTRVWLVGKPNFKGGGLSTTSIHELVNGLSHWALACLGGTSGGDTGPYIYQQSAHDARGLGTGLKAASAEACWTRVACVLCC